MEDLDVQSVRTGSDFWAGAGHETESSSMFTADILGFGSGSGSGSGSSAARRLPSQEDIRNQRERAIQRQKQQQQGRAKNGKRAAFRRDEDEDSSSDSDGTQIAGHGGGVRPVLDAPRRPPPPPSEIVDEVGAQDAFVAGMMWALSRRLLPGEPYTPSAKGDVAAMDADSQKGRWRLEECLRYVSVRFVCAYVDVD